MEKIKKKIFVTGWVELLLSASGGILFGYATIDAFIHGTLAMLMVVFTIPLTVYSARLFFLSVKILKFEDSARIKIRRLHTSAFFFCVPVFAYFLFFSVIMFFSPQRDLNILFFSVISGGIIALFGWMNYLLTHPDADGLFI